MITKSVYASAATWAFPLALMALIMVLQALGAPVHDALRYDRAAIAAGQWWRLLSGSFVHLGWYHLALNEAGLLVLVLLCPEPMQAGVWLRRIVVVGIGMGLCLFALVPALPTYVGMSGIIHGLFVLGLVPQIKRHDPVPLACLAYLLGKLAFEMIKGAAVSDEQALGGSVVLQSHFYGSLAAVAYGLAFRSFWRPETAASWRRLVSRRGEP